MAEFSIIQQYFQSLTAQSVAVGIGDDCAVFSPPSDQQLVSCVDTLVAGRHFPMDTSPYAIGWKSVAVNLSDLAAMGARPHSILLALSLPKIDSEWLAEFSRGMAECCQRYHVQLIGGDTTQNPTLTISITALGFLPMNTAIQRCSAQVGDWVAVSGAIGSAAYALRHPQSALQMTLDCPVPQVELGLALRGYASSMIDISDGLAQDLGHILDASQVGARIHFSDIPVASELAELDFATRMPLVLSGGDDYQLCFTISEEKLQQFQKTSSLPIYIIGQIESELACRYDYEQCDFLPQTLGYQHFAASSD